MVELHTIAPFAAILAGITTGIIVITDDSRIKIGLVFFQYALSSILLNLAAPIQIVVIKFVSGLTVCLILFVTARMIGEDRHIVRGFDLPAGRAFRMIAVLLVSTAAVGIGRSEFVSIPGIAPEALSAALLLGGLGLLQVSLLERPSNVVIGVISLLNGFEIVYVVLETSIAVMALIAMVHISVSVVIGIIELDVEEQDLQKVDL
jgi:hypothetical protein